MSPRAFFWFILCCVLAMTMALLLFAGPALEKARTCKINPTATECVKK